jgi:hypothetical protein
MLEVDPDEYVSLHMDGAMSARSAIQKVMLEWTATMRHNLKITQDVVILRKNTPSILKISKSYGLGRNFKLPRSVTSSSFTMLLDWYCYFSHSLNIQLRDTRRRSRSL